MASIMSINSGLLGTLAVTAAAVGTAQAAPDVPDPIYIGNAVFTGRNFVDTARPGEKTHKEIFDLLYGGDFQAVGLDYTNGEYYMQRIPDDLLIGDQVSIGLAATSLFEYTDQTWFDNFSSVEAHYRFAGYQQSFGYTLATQDNGNGPQLLPAVAGDIPAEDYEKLFDVTWQSYGDNYEPIGVHASMPDLGGAAFHWARGRDNGIFTSNPSLNRDGMDHVITYKVIPLTQGPELMGVAEEQVRSFLLFWEDQTVDDNVHWYDKGDWDYNDLVVEVRAQYNNGVPEPSALALAGIGAVGLLRRRRR